MPKLPTGHIARRLKNLVTLPARPRPNVGATPADVVHTENKWRLLRYRARPEGLAYDTPVLLVPSLINRHYVLDLMPGKSFAEWMVARGHDVYIIDWGTPGDEDRYLTFDVFADDYIGRALRIASKNSPRGKAHLLGYCLGGTLTAIHAALHPERVASLLTLAAPVRFGQADDLLSVWTRTTELDLDALAAGFGNVPWQLMQSAFHMLRPTMNLSKATYMLDQAWDDQFLDGFFAIETWGNDNVSFPGVAYAKYIQRLYRDDALARGELAINGRRVHLADVTCPTLSICFYHDNIVPLVSAEELTDLVSSTDATTLRLSGGHVGAVVSRKASSGLWPTISDWFIARDADAPAQPEVAATRDAG